MRVTVPVLEPHHLQIACVAKIVDAGFASRSSRKHLALGATMNKMSGLLGFIDSTRVGFIAVIVMLNTGFLPIEQTQKGSVAALGVCGGPIVKCTTCVLTPPAGTCTVATPVNYPGNACAGFCGFCSVGTKTRNGTKPKITNPNQTLPCTCSVTACS